MFIVKKGGLTDSTPVFQLHEPTFDHGVAEFTVADLIRDNITSKPCPFSKMSVPAGLACVTHDDGAVRTKVCVEMEDAINEKKKSGNDHEVMSEDAFDQLIALASVGFPGAKTTSNSKHTAASLVTLGGRKKTRSKSKINMSIAKKKHTRKQKQVAK